MGEDTARQSALLTRAGRLEQAQRENRADDETSTAGPPPAADRLVCPSCHQTIDGDLVISGNLQCEKCGASFRVDVVSQASTIAEIRVLGRFQLLDRVGQGTFGTVWRAHDRQLDRVVALKVPHAHVLESGADVERVCREARAAAQLRHPGIVRLYELVTVDEIPVLVSDFIEGLPLKDLLNIRRLTFHETAELVAQVAEALDHAHNGGLIHRDVKPANIMIEYRRHGESENAPRDFDGSRELGKPIIVDFGLALRPESDVIMTMYGEIVGTPAYMSPEQASGVGREVDRRSDVYSLGVVLYQLLCGELPFRGTKLMKLHQVQHEMPRPPRRVHDRIPRDLETICLKAMAKLRSFRYATAAEMALDLRRFLRGEPCLARPVGDLERARLWVRRNRSLAAVGALTCASLVAIAVFGVFFALREREHAAELGTRLGESYFDRGFAMCDEGDVAQGMLLMARGLSAVPKANSLARALKTNLTAWSTKLDPLVALERHGGRITAAAFSPDGQIAVTGSDDQTVRLWDAATLRPIGEPVVCGDPPRAFRFEPGTRGLQIVRQKEKLLEWDLERRTFRGAPLEQGNPIHTIAYSHDGNTAVTQDGTHKIRFWDLKLGRPLARVLDCGRSTHMIAFSSDDRSVVTVTKTGKIQRWDVNNGLECETPAVHLSLQSACLSPDGRLLATGGTDRSARVWDAVTLKLIHDLRHPSEVDAVAFSPDSRTLLTGCADKVARFWAVESASILSMAGLHRRGVTAVAFSPDGSRILTGGDDGLVQLRRCTSNGTQCLELAHRASVGLVELSPSGLITVAGTKPRGTAEGDLQLWHTSTGQPLGRVSHAGVVIAIAFSRDEKTVATASADGTALLVDTASGKPRGAPLKHPGWVTAVAFNAQGDLLFTGCDDGVTRVWEVATGQCSDRIFAHRDMVTSLALSADGSLLLTASADGTAKLWAVASGKALHTFTHKAYVCNAMFSPDGTKILTASYDGSARLWSVESGQPIGTPMMHENEVLCAALSPRGDLILTGSMDKSAQLWTTRTTTPFGPALLHQGPVRAVAFSSDLTTVATGSDDSTARLWDIATQRPVGPAIRHRNIVADLKFTPDGRHLITGSTDGSLRICDTPGAHAADRLDWTSWVQALCGMELSENGAPRALSPAHWRDRQGSQSASGDLSIAR